MIISNMMLITSTWGDPAKPTFKMIPLTLDCPFQECIFDTETKSLAIISKIPMKKFVMLPKLDSMGNRMMEFGKDKKAPIGYKQERIQIDSFNEYYIENGKEILSFVLSFAVNYDKEWEAKIIQFLIKKEVPAGNISISGMTAVKDEVNPEAVN